MLKQNVSITTLAAIAAFILCLFAIALGFKPAMQALGRADLYHIALEKGYCETDRCEEGITKATGILVRQSGIAPELVPWCMAANHVNYLHLWFADPLKTKFADWMYQRCERNDLTLDDVNISIGEPDDTIENSPSGDSAHK